MHKSKLIHLLRTLNKRELNRFEDYLHSSIFKIDKRCVRLFDIIKHEHPNYASELLEKEKVFAALFPNKKYNSSLRAIMALLTKDLEDFLVLSKVYSDEEYMYRNYLLLDTLHFKNKNKAKYFSLLFKQVDKELTQQKYRSADFYFEKYRIYEEWVSFLSLPKKERAKVGLQELLEVFANYELLYKLRYWCEILNEAGFLQRNYNHEAFQQFINGITPSIREEIPAVAIYYNVLQMLTNEKHEIYFNALQSCLEQYSTHLPKNELASVYTHTLNYCVRQVTSGKLAYYEAYFSIYLARLQQDLLFDGAYIHPRHIKNIGSVALRLQKFDWIKGFMEEYGDKVAPQFRDSVHHFNMGALYYYQQNYNEAIIQLHQVDYIDVFYHCDCKALLLKSYYELEETQALLPLCDTFKAYLKNNKELGVNRKKSYHNFVLFTLRLYRIKALMGKKSLDDLEQSIRGTALNSDKKWLLEKVAELQKVHVKK